ncbi:MAG TPA: M48 family metallopeptidase [Bacteroidia bacterium]|nr:M48 family metallopeptidase [Bacteroidia bacterium]
MLTILILILIVGFVFDRILDILNLKSLVPELPVEASGIYDKDKYRKSQEYYRVNHRFSQLTSAFSFVLILLMLFFGGFGYLDNYLREYTQEPILLTLLYFGFLGFASDLLSMPFSIYKIFVIEEKFGFNKTTIKLFFMDKIKGYILSVLLGGLLIAGLVKIYMSTGEYFWVLAWLLMTLVMIFVSMFYTSIFLPIFNKLSPLEDGELRTAIKEYCAKAGFQLNNIFVMDGSKRSSKANAFFSGLGKKKKIVLYDTLISKHSTEELVAILAHETGHYKLKHTRTGLITGILQTGVMLFILSLFLGNDMLAKALGAQSSAFHLDLIAFGILYSPVSTLLGIVTNMLSRKHEYEADLYARTSYKAEPLIEALKKLSSDNLSNLVPHPAYVFVHYSHPPLLKRLAALRKE